MRRHWRPRHTRQRYGWYWNRSHGTKSYQRLRDSRSVSRAEQYKQNMINRPALFIRCKIRVTLIISEEDLAEASRKLQEMTGTITGHSLRD
jgi:hypothetical protein